MTSMTQRPLWRAVSTFLLVLVLTGAMISAALFFVTVRDVVAQTSVPYTERVVRTRQSAAPGEEAPTPVFVAPSVPELVEKQERVNVLLLGIDQRENDPGPWRTDTMILLSIDMATESAAMLSIPRDLWVTIPGYGENRINMAHFLGDYRDYPGGGVALAKKTVWSAMGVPVHYYVRINFSGFERAVDAIGGLDIEVSQRIYDETYPDGNYGIMLVDIPAGPQQMDGKTALQFARSRHGSSDFDRMARQQQVIMAVRDKAVGMDIPLSSIPRLIEILGDTVQTDLTLDEILALAEVARKIDRANIQHAIIDDSITTTVITPTKAMVEVADWEKVRVLVNELFPAAGPTPEPTREISADLLAQEDARIALRNGTLSAGLSRQTTDVLRGEGFAVVSFGNADRFDFLETLLIVYADKPYTREALADRLLIDPKNVIERLGQSDDIDLEVILGRDAAQRASETE
jgi:LCP family protein required for cell wall assembly